MNFWKNAFQMELAEDFQASPREQELLDRLADRLCRHGLGMPAILFLETCRPLNFVGSQSLAFLEPIVLSVFDWEGYADFRRLLERRGSIEALIRAVEQAESRRRADQQTAHDARQAAKKRARDLLRHGSSTRGEP